MAKAAPYILVAVALIAAAIISSSKPTPRARSRLAGPLSSGARPTPHNRSGFTFSATTSIAAVRAAPGVLERRLSSEPPTPVAVVRKAAGHYFKDMFGTTTSALPPAFDDGVNPCWGAESRRHCLPGFLILGVYQSGVRDLYSRIALHPSVAKRAPNSPSYYAQVHPTWGEYVRELDRAAGEASAGKLLGEASAVTFHFVWVHQEKFNQPYVDAMGRFWRACNARSSAEKAAVPHRECMGARMADGRAEDAALARAAGMPMAPDTGQIAQERTFSVPQLVRAVYGEWAPKLIVLLRRPWARMHAAFYNYVHYKNRYGAHAAGEASWANESVVAFRRCEGRFGTDHCALSFESLTRENEEVFYHCDQLIKGRPPAASHKGTALASAPASALVHAPHGGCPHALCVCCYMCYRHVHRLPQALAQGARKAAAAQGGGVPCRRQGRAHAMLWLSRPQTACERRRVAADAGHARAAGGHAARGWSSGAAG